MDSEDQDHDPEPATSATGTRLREPRPIRDVRGLSALLEWLAPLGLARIHRSYVVILLQVHELRRQRSGVGRSV